jgi:hypothetical protein
MDAVIRIPAVDFNEALFKKIGKLIEGRNAEVIITVKDADGLVPNENDYWRKIDTSINELKEGKGTAFTMESFEKFIRSE